MQLTSTVTLRALVAQRGLTLSEMARRSGCSKSFISHLTAGRKHSCTPERALAIAEALRVPLDLLFVPTESSATERSIRSNVKAVAS